MALTQIGWQLNFSVDDLTKWSLEQKMATWQTQINGWFGVTNMMNTFTSD